MDYDAAKQRILYLIDTELLISNNIVSKYKSWVQRWEQAFSVFDNLVSKTKIHPSYGPLAGLVSEAHSSLRVAYLTSLKGYYPEALSILRRVHQAVVKTIYCKKISLDHIQIKIQDVLKTSPAGFEAKLGWDLKWLYNIESGYTHSDVLQIYKTFKSRNKPTEIPYGPQIPQYYQNMEEFQSVANASIFWLLIVIKFYPWVFKKMIDMTKIEDYQETIELLESYLKQSAKGNLFREYEKMTKFIEIP